MRFNPNTSPLAGMSDADLRAHLSALQSALLQLGAGDKPQTVEVTGGGQHRSVTFTKADIGQINYQIRLIQAQLGIIASPRGSCRVVFS